MNEARQTGALLADRIALITGGGGGIGAATARLFARHGARVVIADSDADRGEQTAVEITAAARAGSSTPTRNCGTSSTG